ncbi:MAG: ThuA domain-containing protein [Chloroflexi bacterium]|nr:ThuA domain-containing protein [Chloroflexota bacterium]
MSPISLDEIQVLLLLGGPEYHNTPAHREALTELLKPVGTLIVRDDLEILTDEGLTPFNVIINYSTFLEPTPRQASALNSAIFRGKGFVGIHGATATFWNSPEYLRMLGSTFIVHDALKTFKVQFGSVRCTEQHPITEDIEDFDIEDELYIVEGDQTQWHILARAEGHPLLYTKMYGNGRVHYNALGHDNRALTHPSFQKLVLNSVEWAARIR